MPWCFMPCMAFFMELHYCSGNFVWTHTGRTLGTHGVTLAHCTEKPQSRAKGGLPQAPGMDGLRARAGHHAAAHSSAGTAGRLQQLPLGERQSQLLAVDVSDGRKLFGLKAKDLGAKLGGARPADAWYGETTRRSQPVMRSRRPTRQ